MVLCNVFNVTYFVFRQKEQMMKKNEGKTVNQLHLFHGTDESLVQAISEQNFDWRICGAHGTAYGKGMVGQFQGKQNPICWIWQLSNKHITSEGPCPYSPFCLFQGATLPKMPPTQISTPD